MGGPDAAQAKLDTIVKTIAANMVAEVCSLYVLRPGHVLELYATEGLKVEAVHKSNLKLGEGLVGTIAATGEVLNLSEAQSHPAFKYLPETGEEIYHSFLGVPVMRAGDTIGVLVVQNRTPRHYSEEEEEALQITAMVLAEVVAAGALIEVADAVEADIAHTRAHHLRGQGLAGGIALGHAVLHVPRIVITNFIAESIPDERDRLEEAIERLRIEVDDLIAQVDVGRGDASGEVLEAFRMFAYDRGWVSRIRQAVDTGLTAEAAAERVHTDMRNRLLRQPDPYLRERLHDIDDLTRRLLRILTGHAATASQTRMPRDAILIARHMGAAELLDYDRMHLRGLVLEESSTNSHVAIVARALGVPVVGQAEGVIDTIETGDAIIVDGETGDVHIRPSSVVEQAYVEKVRFYAKRQAKFAQLRNRPAVTLDGTAVSLNINAGLMADMPHLAEAGADGIGLFRTELQFMVARSLPGRGQQCAHYRAIMEAAKERPVVFRSLDIGSDKMLPYLRSTREENPAMGLRGTRMALGRKAFLPLQIRALLEAGAGHDLWIMFPMIANVTEFLAARAVVEEQCALAEKVGRAPPAALHLGAMIEIPSLVWQLDDLLPKVDFVSVGSNDLMQYVYACDREHPLLSERYDTLSSAFLRLLAQVVERCKAHGVPLTLCGEMAGRPLEAMALLGLGLTSISMTPAAIGPVKTMLLTLNVGKLADFMKERLVAGQENLRADLQRWAENNGVAIAV
jgi:phosphotransferase system enzyme I (PtsP)